MGLTRLGVDRVKPWILLRMDLGWAGLDWNGPDIIPGLYNRQLIIVVIESHGRSRKVMDGLFPSLDQHFR